MNQIKEKLSKGGILIVVIIFSVSLMIPAIFSATVSITSSNGNFDITYSNHPSEYDANCTATEINDLGDLLEDIRDLYVNNYNFIAPPTNFDIRIENMTEPNGSGWCAKIRLDPVSYTHLTLPTILLV